MRRISGKTVSMAIAGMCLASTLAMAQPAAPGQTMVCTKVDASGECIEATSHEDTMMSVRVQGVKVREKLTCVTTGGSTTCTKVTVVQ